MKRSSFKFLVGLMFIVTACGSEENTQQLSIAADGEPLNFSLKTNSCSLGFNIHISADRTQISGTMTIQPAFCEEEAVIAEPQTLRPAQVEAVKSALNSMTVTEFSGESCTERKTNQINSDGAFAEVAFAGKRFGQAPNDCFSLNGSNLDSILEVFFLAMRGME